MDRIEISSLAELVAQLSNYDNDMLFRGQTRDFSSQSESGLKTSFDRRGCVPPVMIQWSHYATFALVQLLGVPIAQNKSLEFNQALLQHYGWRSFFLDATESPAIAAWFAGNTWKGEPVVELVEDCFEAPVFLHWQHALYEPEEGDGFIYVLSKTALAKQGVGTTALSVIELQDCRPRFHAQRAWLVGPLRNENLPIECVRARIKAPRAVLRELASTNGIEKTEDLFPPAAEDPVLHIFLSMPWLKIPTKVKRDNSIMPSAFRRSIELPEYSRVITKHMPSNTAFFSDQRASEAGLDGAIFVQMPNIIIFGTADPQPQIFPRIVSSLEQHEHIAFEIEQITWLPESVSRADFGKGIVVARVADGTIAVSDLIVRHPGQQLRGVGVNMPWHYRVGDDGLWTRQQSSSDCPCNNDWRHKRHLSALAIIDHYLDKRSDLVD